MSLLPQFHQIVKMGTCHIQNMTHVVLFGVARLDSIPSFSDPHNPIDTEHENYRHSLIAAVNMRRFVILRINTKSYAVEPV